METGRWKQRQRRPRPVGVGVGVKVAVLESLADKVWTSNNHLRTRHAHHGMIGRAEQRMGRSTSTVNWRAGRLGCSLGVFTTLLLLYLLFVRKFAHVSQFLFSRVLFFGEMCEISVERRGNCRSSSRHRCLGLRSRLLPFPPLLLWLLLLLCVCLLRSSCCFCLHNYFIASIGAGWLLGRWPRPQNYMQECGPHEY